PQRADQTAGVLLFYRTCAGEHDVPTDCLEGRESFKSKPPLLSQATCSAELEKSEFGRPTQRREQFPHDALLATLKRSTCHICVLGRICRPTCGSTMTSCRAVMESTDNSAFGSVLRLTMPRAIGPRS